MKKVQFILKENTERFDEEGNILPDKVSTLGYKFEFRGKWYGDYLVINKPTMTAQDIIDAINELCPKLEQTLKEIQTDTKSI